MHSFRAFLLRFWHPWIKENPELIEKNAHKGKTRDVILVFKIFNFSPLPTLLLEDCEICLFECWMDVLP